MIKSLEMSDPNSCLSKAREDELLFVLLARDPAAPVAIEAWANERIRLRKNSPDDSQIAEALACAQRMRLARGAVNRSDG